ncbi:MAG: LPP20 family lipoprotein [Treponema sp.]|nr:LPP20 family lipoprotein [Treponema sp.]
MYLSRLSPGEDMVLFGVSGIRLNRDEAISLALEDAARQAAFFEQVEGWLIQRELIGPGFLDYRSDNVAELYFSQDYRNLVADLRFDPENDVFIYNQALFVRVRYPGADRGGISYLPNRINGRPGWIDNPPAAISGYAAGVGYAGPRLFFKDAVIASYENAAFSIIKNTFTTLIADESQMWGPGAFDFSSTSSNQVAAKGVLRGFYILDTWADPRTMAVWTLAVAREAVRR